MDREYIISAVSDQTKPITTQYGSLVGYQIKFEGQADVVSLNQKPETPAPTVGQKLFGHLEPTPYGMKFKKASQFDNQSINQPAFGGGFTEEDRKILKEIHAEVCPTKSERAEIDATKDTVVEDFDDSQPVDLTSIPF